MHGNISPKKRTGTQQKISRGPQNLGQIAPLPAPLSEALAVLKLTTIYSLITFTETYTPIYTKVP
jgi:hypothetical protein